MDCMKPAVEQWRPHGAILHNTIATGLGSSNGGQWWTLIIDLGMQRGSMLDAGVVFCTYFVTILCNYRNNTLFLQFLM